MGSRMSTRSCGWTQRRSQHVRGAVGSEGGGAHHGGPRPRLPGDSSALAGGGLSGDFAGLSDAIHWGARPAARALESPGRDRKSTRLNSSHVRISYAVFCLKKKKKKNN